MCLLLLLIFLTGVRIRSVVLTRRIHAVLAGLEQVRVDQTSEEQLLKTVPYLVREGDYPIGQVTERHYRVDISNEDDRKWLQRLAGTRPILFLFPWPEVFDAKQPLERLSFPYKLAHWLGWRYIGFAAFVGVQGGRIFNVGYAVEADIEQGWPRSPAVFVRSFHGLWRAHALPVPVSDADDESPAYRLEGTERMLVAAYSPDAPPELIGHAFQVDLSCYWSFRGCNSTRKLAPNLWRDKEAIQARATARLHGAANPCPESVLTGRIRYLPDLKVEIVDNGDRLLVFTGAKFDSCQTVPATPSAEAAVRSAVPPHRRREDEISIGGRM